jgi:hypothetical protein
MLCGIKYSSGPLPLMVSVPVMEIFSSLCATSMPYYSSANRHRSSNHYPITVIWQLKPLDTHFPIPDIETEDSFILLRVPG